MAQPTSQTYDNTAPLQFHRTLLECYQKATQAVGIVAHTYRIAGYVIRFEFAGSAMIGPLTPALDHLRTYSDSQPALTICIWDSDSTATKIVSPPWGIEAFANRGHITAYNTERLFTLFQQGEDTLNMLDSTTNVGLFWRRSARDIPYYTTGSPLRSLFSWWMHKHDRQLLHAAAVGTQEGAAIVVGKGGSGKSTVALACLDSDMLYVGDDYVLLEPAPTPLVHSLYSSAKLDAHHIREFPHLLPLVYNQRMKMNADGKALLLLQRHYPERIATALPIKALVVPEVIGTGPTRLVEIPRSVGLAALAPSTIFQMPWDKAASFRTIAQYVRTVPCYRLELGENIAAIPSVLSQAL